MQRNLGCIRLFNYIAKINSHCVDPDLRRHYHKPLENEFSLHDFDCFQKWFIFFVALSFDFDTEKPKKDFARTRACDMSTYGYINGVFFDESFDSRDSYEKKTLLLKGQGLKASHSQIGRIVAELKENITDQGIGRTSSASLPIASS